MQVWKRASRNPNRRSGGKSLIRRVDERRRSRRRWWLESESENRGTMKSMMANLWHPVRGVQIRDLGEKRGPVIDPMLGFNLEGCSSALDQQNINIPSNLPHSVIEHDMEDSVLIEEKGKKRTRGVIEEISRKNGNTEGNKRKVESNLLLSAAIRRYIPRIENRRAYTIAKTSLRRRANVYLENEDQIQRTGGEMEHWARNPD
ncbi:hypothetical protein J1N35_000908 [Gossypium stocksii]|uniref:Uncharacterized protein n=1 Tax=Gossypium stocksii TaxID=47602 RepID=A0A9D3WII9_9ROSI|nr:hypothetical protein J1N35_000908 [Gossypium stocksii]